jgi:hypothetical protein
LDLLGILECNCDDLLKLILDAFEVGLEREAFIIYELYAGLELS